MTLSRLFKRVGITAALALSSTAVANNFGLLGGQDDNGTSPPLGLLLSPTGEIANLNLSSFLSTGLIQWVAINDSGIGLLVGQGGGTSPFFPIGYHVSPTGAVTDLDIASVISEGSILGTNGVAINASGQGLLGGVNSTPIPAVPFAFTVSPSGVLSPQLTFPGSVNGAINAVAINDSGTGLVGGQNNLTFAPLGFLLQPPSTTFTDLHLSAQVSLANMVTVAINNSGAGLLGGRGGLSNNQPIAFYLTPPTTINQLSPFPAGGAIFSVAINDSGVGILGGYDVSGMQPPIAYLVSPSRELQNLNLSNYIVHGQAVAVAINNSGVGLIGGSASASLSDPIVFPFAFLVSPTGVLTDLKLSSFVSQGEIIGVAINEFGAGLIAGEELSGTMPPMTFLVCPTGEVIQLDLSSFTTFGEIYSVAINNLMISLCGCHIPTDGLTGNNLRLANYINKYAPYDACYFIPSEMDGTLNQALKSAAPTRNAFALFTADNNLFSLNTMISRHSRDSRSFRRQISQETQTIAMEESAPGGRSTGLLLASIPIPTYCKRPMAEPSEVERPYQLWGSILGALSYQKAEHQSPAFNPTTGGAILAFDAKATTHGWLGGGAAYAYTHIHEKQDAGHSNINQEYLFLYALWDNTRLYFDAALWGGLYQVDNVRNIHMTGFEFTSKSHPLGWQLSPHFEMGYDFNSACNRFTVEPFVMFDWANNWQHRYKEKGSGPFNMVQKHHYSSFLRSEAGVRFYEVVPYENWSLVFQETSGYVNKKPFKVGTVNAFIVGAPGSFTVETFTTTQNLGVVEFALIFEPNDPHYPYGTVAYQGEFGSQYQSHLVSFDICWNF